MNSSQTDKVARDATRGPKTKLIFIQAKSEERMELLRRLKQRKKHVIANENDIIILMGYRRLPAKQRKRKLKLLLAAERIGKAIIVENLYSRLPAAKQQGLPFPNFVWNRYIHILLGLCPKGYEKLFYHLSNRCIKLHTTESLA